MLGRAEEGEVFVVSEDLDWEEGAMKVMTPSLEGTDYSKEFVIVDIIITFRRWEELGEISAGMPFSIRVSLKK